MADLAKKKTVRDKQFSALFALFTTVSCCAIIVLATPRALVPSDLPPLVLDPERVAGALADDAALAAKAPAGDDIAELERYYLAEVRAERGQPLEQNKALFNQRRLQRLAGEVFTRVGPAGVSALRARALAKFMQALQARPHGPVTDPAFGAFPDLLRTYGLLNERGELVAPGLCLRANFKARWNLIHGLPVSHDLSVIEKQAFEGWFALHAEKAPNQRRVQGARAYYEAGGYRATQALAVWSYRVGQSSTALMLMRRAHAERPELFTRNYALGLASSQL